MPIGQEIDPKYREIAELPGLCKPYSRLQQPTQTLGEKVELESAGVSGPKG